MTLRVVHRLRLPDADAAQLVTEIRELRGRRGCAEAEAYSFLSAPEEIAVVELWDDEEAFDAARGSRADGPTDLLHDLATTDSVRTEIYRHSPFAVTDGRWVPTLEDRTATVQWPAAGAVRIVIQSCFADPEEERPSLMENEAETRREPGCLEYGWMTSLDEPTHVLLIELWEDQLLYDRHWALRARSGQLGRPRRRAERRHGSNGAEFYRMQRFRHLYGRWLPADPRDWSTSVDWPN